ncbi:MAG: hypothetical protein L6Q95_05695 [Planctomycetes bacterium]|nr:hypothetical protein [Planctomycetota bacterium]
MRVLVPLLLLAIAAEAQPPAVRDFRRLRKLRDDIASQYASLREQEEFALKPREEKLLIAFGKGEKKFEGKTLDGEGVLSVILKWDEVLRDPPTEAGKRVLGELPNVLFERYAKPIEIPKDRKEVALKLCDGLDSDSIHVRFASFEALKRIYRTPSGFMYVVDMPKKDRQDAIKSWRNYVRKQK